MFAFLAALVLAQPAPDVGVVVSRSAGVMPARIAKLLTRLEQQLSEGQVKSLSRKELATRMGRLSQQDATFCAGKPSCLAELGRQLPVDVVIGLSMTFLTPDLSVVVEAVRSSDGTSLADFSRVLGPADKESQPSFEDFAARVRAAMTAKPAEPVADVPLKPVGVEPLPPTPSLVALTPMTPPARRSLVPAVMAGAGAVAALAIGAGLAVSSVGKNESLSRGEALPDGRIQSPLTQSQALAARNGANAELNGAIGCAIGAAVLGVLTVLLWPPAPSP